MKNLIKSILLLATISLFASSCTARKQHCDAYGSVAIEKTSNNSTQTTNVYLNKEEKI